MSYMYFRSLVGTLCGILLALSFAGCVTKFETGSEQAPDANFARRSTFRFVPDKSQAAAEAVASGPDWRGLISQDILTALNGKGYRFFPNRQTDLLVAFHIVLTENESVTTLDNYLGYPLTAGQSAQADLSRFQDPNHPGEASKGTLIIDFIDPEEKGAFVARLGEDQCRSETVGGETPGPGERSCGPDPGQISEPEVSRASIDVRKRPGCTRRFEKAKARPHCVLSHP